MGMYALYKIFRNKFARFNYVNDGGFNFSNFNSSSECACKVSARRRAVDTQTPSNPLKKGTTVKQSICFSHLRNVVTTRKYRIPSARGGPKRRRSNPKRWPRIGKNWPIKNTGSEVRTENHCDGKNGKTLCSLTQSSISD